MTALTEPAPLDGGRTPLEQLITTGQALIDEARAAIAEHQAPMVFTTLEHAVVDGPAYITVADWDAAIRAAERHTIRMKTRNDSFLQLACDECDVLATVLKDEAFDSTIAHRAAVHKVEVVLEAAHVEVRRG